MIDRIKALCAEQGININQLEKKCGISIGTISHWRKSKPRADVLAVVADNLGVSMEYLLTGNSPTVLYSITPGAAPKGEDKELLDAYHRATDADREIIDFIVARYAAPIIELRPVPLLGTAAAAGHGEPDTGLPWESYDVPADSPAEFAVRVSGDSMAPVLTDGEIALCVKKRPDIGDLAVIMVNGSLLVKQYIRDNYGNVYLRSLNRKRKDCDYDLMSSGNDTAMYYGKVILDKKIPLVDD